jgi:hypothetical protein
MDGIVYLMLIWRQFVHEDPRNYVVSDWEEFNTEWDRFAISQDAGYAGIFRKTDKDLRMIMNCRDIRVIRAEVREISVFSKDNLKMVDDILSTDDWIGCKFVAEIYNNRQEELGEITMVGFQLRLPEEFVNLQKHPDLTFSDSAARLFDQTQDGRQAKERQRENEKKAEEVLSSEREEDQQEEVQQDIHVYTSRNGRSMRKLEGHEGGIWALQYWGRVLVSGSTDQSVRVWDVETGTSLFTLKGMWSIQINWKRDVVHSSDNSSSHLRI